MGPWGERSSGVPAQETRGGNRVDWDNVVTGEPLPELPADAYPEKDSQQLPLFTDEELEPRDPEEAFLDSEDEA